MSFEKPDCFTVNLEINICVSKSNEEPNVIYGILYFWANMAKRKRKSTTDCDRKCSPLRQKRLNSRFAFQSFGFSFQSVFFCVSEKQ